MRTRQVYPSDLTDKQWEIVEPLLPKPAKTGRPRHPNMRGIVNGMLYLNRTGCQWRYLPKDYPKWRTVYNYFAKWAKHGTLHKLMTALGESVRIKAGRDAQPSAGSIDSQSVKSHYAGSEVDYDAGKKVAGRKRHIVVDTMGLLLDAEVTSAKVDDAQGAQKVLAHIKPSDRPRLKKLKADQKYHNYELYDWLKQNRPGLELEIVRRREGAVGFELLPDRWVVERTFAWLGRCRRNSKDYEHTTPHSAAQLKLSMVALMINRLSRRPRRWCDRFRYKRVRRCARLKSAL